MKSNNPTPKSPEQIAKDPAYKVMHDYIRGSYYPSADEVIVKHIESETFWKAVYSVRDDDSDYCFGATWRQVAPKSVITTEYNDVKEKK